MRIVGSQIDITPETYAIYAREKMELNIFFLILLSLKRAWIGKYARVIFLLAGIRQFSGSLGFPSPDKYCFIQDQTGMIWFCLKIGDREVDIPANSKITVDGHRIMFEWRMKVDDMVYGFEIGVE